MTVAFLSDPGNADGTIGGAEITMGEFERCAPEPLVEFDGADTVVVGNCTSFGPDLIPHLCGKRVVWFHHDLSPHIHPQVKEWLDSHATHLFCSPLQRDRYGLGGELVPPAIDLERFRSSRNDRRDGMVSVGSWQNQGKGQQLLWEYATKHGPVDVWGTGVFCPTEPPLAYRGAIEPDQVPETLAGYRTFIHLPWVVEPFGRCVVEAWASGCDLVTNRLVGARYWLEERPEGLESAGERFWELVLDG